MARSVDQINIGNWQLENPTPKVNQYSVDVEVYWTKYDGTKGEYSGTHLFPNELADIPLTAIKEFMRKIIEAKVRVNLGIDTWEMYE